MKTNKILSYLFIAVLSIVFHNCSEKELVMVDDNAETTLQLSSEDALVLTEDMESETALTLSWSRPDFGFEGAVPSYSLVFTVSGATEVSPKQVNVGNTLEKAFTVKELNTILNQAGAVAGIENQISIKVQALLGETSVAESNAKTITATSYSTILDLSSTWGLVGSATPNGWDGPDVPFYKTSTGNVFVTYVTLVDGEIKIRENNDWTLNYGDTGADGTLEEGGDNIMVTAGTYKITFSLNDFSYTIEVYSWGLVGSATTNGWDGPDMPLTYDATSDKWRAVVTLASGEVKIRNNNDWALNYGDTGADGTLEEGGDNIVVASGNYLVTVDFNNLEYTIESIDIWGVVGSAAPNGWDGPDVRFTPDYANEGVWVLNGVTLADGEIKFRTNDDWGLNYGDDGVDGTLDQDGANIAVSAGTYNIRLDFSDENNPTYTIN
ncbi:SusE domain-containing protein [Snuella sedimenti]|uniref:SusF/SusE family outer membrane protein n=1 Tax=Snuella sedimenti TaxID=2798802 RepID=A0A8J7IP19_9FLAO|nr:SusF/SusE family outer membrane protein [Snuella sedimenti]MBJ6368277.1 SusF/SusE family outer membrane protein [Snuella sedimenti]